MINDGGCLMEDRI